MKTEGACPCGGGISYTHCCEPFHTGQALPPTAEALMRSRYSAFVLGLADYLWRTWHPRTRPQRVHLDDTVWTGLEIVDVVDGAAIFGDDLQELVELGADLALVDGRIHDHHHFVGTHSYPHLLWTRATADDPRQEG